jgi:hypothetical protein
MARVPTVPVPANCIVITTSNHGGYTGGTCILCNEHGWTNHTPNGLPHGSKSEKNNLRHDKRCPMNLVLSDDGTFKKGER